MSVLEIMNENNLLPLKLIIYSQTVKLIQRIRTSFRSLFHITSPPQRHTETFLESATKQPCLSRVPGWAYLNVLFSTKELKYITLFLTLYGTTKHKNGLRKQSKRILQGRCRRFQAQRSKHQRTEEIQKYGESCTAIGGARVPGAPSRYTTSVPYQGNQVALVNSSKQASSRPGR